MITLDQLIEWTWFSDAQGGAVGIVLISTIAGKKAYMGNVPMPLWRIGNERQCALYAARGGCRVRSADLRRIADRLADGENTV